MKLIIDLDTNYNYDEVQIGTIILTSNILLEGNNKKKIDFLILENFSETADTINHYFKVLPISLLPFKNDFYMKVFN